MIHAPHYAITPHNIRGHEIIGLAVTVSESTDRTRIGITGMVMDETHHTLVICGNHKTKKATYVLPKKECVFLFDVNGEKVAVPGKDIAKRPEDRVKGWRNA